jgi:hypothetical protein
MRFFRISSRSPATAYPHRHALTRFGPSHAWRSRHRNEKEGDVEATDRFLVRPGGECDSPSHKDGPQLPVSRCLESGCGLVWWTLYGQPYTLSTVRRSLSDNRAAASSDPSVGSVKSARSRPQASSPENQSARAVQRATCIAVKLKTVSFGRRTAIGSGPSERIRAGASTQALAGRYG